VFRLFPVAAIAGNPGRLRTPMADILAFFEDVHDKIQIVAFLDVGGAVLAVSRPFADHAYLLNYVCGF
jgi:hypothetical protein